MTGLFLLFLIPVGTLAILGGTYPAQSLLCTHPRIGMRLLPVWIALIMAAYTVLTVFHVPHQLLGIPVPHDFDTFEWIAIAFACTVPEILLADAAAWIAWGIRARRKRRDTK